MNYLVIIWSMTINVRIQRREYCDDSGFHSCVSLEPRGYLVFIIGLFELSYKTLIFANIHNGISKMNQGRFQLPHCL